MFDEEEELEDKSEGYQALSVFANKYDAAKQKDVTDYFTSREIQNIVHKHTGIVIQLTELHELMIEMKYTYELQDDEFKWLVHDVSLG